MTRLLSLASEKTLDSEAVKSQLEIGRRKTSYEGDEVYHRMKSWHYQKSGFGKYLQETTLTVSVSTRNSYQSFFMFGFRSNPTSLSWRLTASMIRRASEESRSRSVSVSTSSNVDMEFWVRPITAIFSHNGFGIRTLDPPYSLSFTWFGSSPVQK